MLCAQSFWRKDLCLDFSDVDNNNNNNNKRFILSCYSFHEFDLHVFPYTTNEQLVFSLVKKELVPCEFNLTVR